MKDKEKKVNQSCNQFGRAVGFEKVFKDLGSEEFEFFCNADSRLNIDEDLGVGHGQEDEGGMGDHRTNLSNNYDGGEIETTLGDDCEYD